MRLSLFCRAALAAILLFSAMGILKAQSVSFGVKAGVPLTDAVEGSYGFHPEAKRYVVGPVVEIALPFSFAFEANALYRRTGYRAVFSGPGTTSETQVRANSWEFPLLAKYYLRGDLLPLRFFFSGGYVVRHLSGVEAVIHSSGTNLGTGEPFDTTYRPETTAYLLRDNPAHGVAAGVGARLRVGPLRLAPEARYTHWTGVSFDEFGSHGFYVRSLQNQVDLLLGITF